MNILREVRRVKEKSLTTRISIILLFCVILIINTYAWVSAQKDIHINGLTGDVTSWDVYYYINSDENEVLDQTAVFTIDELYPGMPDREDVVHIHNIGTSSTSINYELLSVKVFGQEVLSELDLIQNGNTTTIFAGDTAQNEDGTAYPFNISYTYDKDRLDDKYIDDTTTPQSHATFRLNVSWTYEGTDAQNAAKNALDTQFGKDAYAYYQEASSDLSKAIEIKIKITSSMIRESQ